MGLVYGLTLTLLNEMLLFAGQIAGVQFSFSMVNLLDPTSNIQTPLLGDLFQLMGTLVLITAGLDRILLASVVRSFSAVPLGTFVLLPAAAMGIVRAAGGIFLAAVELAAPLLAATMLVEVAVSLLGKLSPQLPVMNLTVPLKTLTGFALLTGSLALWPRFIEARFAGLLDLAERLITQGGHGFGSAPGIGLGDSQCLETAQNRQHSTAATRLARTAMYYTAASFRPPREPWRASWCWEHLGNTF